MSGRKDIFQKAMEQGHTAAWDQSWDKAAGYYRQALEEFPEHAQALTSLGLALFELQDYEGSLRCYTAAVKVTPDDPVPVEKISQIYEQMGHLDRSDADFLRDAATFYRAVDHGLRVSTGHAEGSLPAADAQLETLSALVRRWTPDHLHDQPLDIELAQIQDRTREFFERLFGKGAG